MLPFVLSGLVEEQFKDALLVRISSLRLCVKSKHVVVLLAFSFLVPLYGFLFGSLRRASSNYDLSFALNPTLCFTLT